jgi:hypothetical protein
LLASRRGDRDVRHLEFDRQADRPNPSQASSLQ